MARAAGAVIALAALILAPGWLFYFDVTPKVAVILIGTAVLAIWPRTAGRAPRWFTLLLVGAAASLAISTALSPNPARSLFGTNWRRFGALTQFAIIVCAWMLAAHTAGRPDRTRTVLRAISAASVVTAVYGIAQFFGVDPILPSAGYHIGEGIWQIVRPPSTLGHVSYFACWQTFAVFLGGPVSAALGVIAVVLSGTRAGMLGLVAGGVIWIVWTRRIRRAAAVAAIAVIALTAFYFSPVGWKLRSRARWFVEDARGGARLYLWRDSIRMAAAHPVVGFGPEMFLAAFPRYQSRELSRQYPDFSHESPHNIFLDALVAQGIPGMLVLIGFCAGGLIAAWRARSAPLAAAITGCLVNQQFSVFTAATALFLFTGIALAAAMASPPNESPRPVWMRAAAVFAMLTFPLLISDFALERTRQALQRRDFASAEWWYAAHRRFRLPGASADLWYSRSLSANAQMLGRARAVGFDATRTSEDPFDAWYSLAALYANSPASAEMCLRAAIAAHPGWFKPHWVLAELLRSESEAAAAADLDGGKHPEVARTLETIRRSQE